MNDALSIVQTFVRDFQTLGSERVAEQLVALAPLAGPLLIALKVAIFPPMYSPKPKVRVRDLLV
jgi:hypothetical protein